MGSKIGSATKVRFLSIQVSIILKRLFISSNLSGIRIGIESISSNKCIFVDLRLKI